MVQAVFYFFTHWEFQSFLESHQQIQVRPIIPNQIPPPLPQKATTTKQVHAFLFIRKLVILVVLGVFYS